MTITNYLGNKLLDYALGKTAFTPDSTLYAGLATLVDSSGTITGEPGTSQGYARVLIVNDDVATVWSTAAAKSKNNANSAITFPVASTSWGTLSYFFLSDGSTQGGGNVYCYGTLSASITPIAGVAPAISNGNLTLTWT
jgi:hypothetical protein